MDTEKVFGVVWELGMSEKCHLSRPESIPLSNRRHWAKRTRRLGATLLVESSKSDS